MIRYSNIYIQTTVKKKKTVARSEKTSYYSYVKFSKVITSFAKKLKAWQ